MLCHVQRLASIPRHCQRLTKIESDTEKADIRLLLKIALINDVQLPDIAYLRHRLEAHRVGHTSIYIPRGLIRDFRLIGLDDDISIRFAWF
jgi:hypothetical protein